MGGIDKYRRQGPGTHCHGSRRKPDLLELILIGISQQSERYDWNDWNRLLGIDIHIRDLPDWFPTPAVVAEIRRQYPALQEAGRYDIQENGDQTRELAAQILYIESQPDRRSIAVRAARQK